MFARVSRATTRVTTSRSPRVLGLRLLAGGAAPLAAAQFPADADGVRALVARERMVLFSKQMCPFCMRVKAALQTQSAAYCVLELDRAPRTQAALAEVSGIATVPQLFVGGELVGDSGAAIAALKDGTVQRLLDRFDAAHSDSKL